MASIFSRIIQGEIPCHKIAEDDRFFAFLDIMPLVPGHTLVVPKQEMDYLFCLDAETYQGLWLFARRISTAVEAAVPCKRIGVAVIGLEVPHAHIHLVPLNKMDDINFTLPKMNPSQEELRAMADKIRANLGV
jgi:histidine triad (HIT) family protein